MPVILDRLPLPNISWYSGISVFCLLCSVYYAGVQVKLHPDWKEQLEQRHNARLEHTSSDHYREDGPLHWGVFNSEHLDDGGYCVQQDEFMQDLNAMHWFRQMNTEAQQLCLGETFENILQSTFYDEMCYIRLNSLDIAFTNFKNLNYARVSHSKRPFSATEYTRRCQQTARKLSLKYNLTTKSGLISLGSHNSNIDGSSQGINSSTNFNADAASNNLEAVNDLELDVAVNSCTTDTFYDSYERVHDAEVSLYHIPLPSKSCGNHEREMSPYLIPEIISFMFHEPLCIWVSGLLFFQSLCIVES